MSFRVSVPLPSRFSDQPQCPNATWELSLRKTLLFMRTPSKVYGALEGYPCKTKSVVPCALKPTTRSSNRGFEVPRWSRLGMIYCAPCPDAFFTVRAGGHCARAHPGAIPLQPSSGAPSLSPHAALVLHPQSGPTKNGNTQPEASDGRGTRQCFQNYESPDAHKNHAIPRPEDMVLRFKAKSPAAVLHWGFAAVRSQSPSHPPPKVCCY